MKKRWKVVQKENALRLSRANRGDAFDFSFSVVWDLPAQPKDPRRFAVTIAHQVRQDIWRALQSVRGFSPLVEVSMDADDPSLIEVRAGGELAGQAPRRKLSERVAQVLESEARQARWANHAFRRAGRKGGAQ